MRGKTIINCDKTKDTSMRATRSSSSSTSPGLKDKANQRIYIICPLYLEICVLSARAKEINLKKITKHVECDRKLPAYPACRPKKKNKLCAAILEASSIER